MLLPVAIDTVRNDEEFLVLFSERILYFIFIKPMDFQSIVVYLEQTPNIITAIKESLRDKNWYMLQAAAHKLISSFSIIGIHKKYEDMTQKIQEYASAEKHLDELPELVLQVEAVCTEACKEFKVEFNDIKKCKM